MSSADGGYLSEPDTEWLKAYNQNLVTLEEISDIPCLVLLGEPGIGKSREMVELSKHTNKFINEEDQILFLDIENFNEQKIHSDLFESEKFTSWINSTGWLYLFIDSFEQGWLTCQNLPKLLTNEFEKLDKIPKSKPLKPIIYLHLAIKTGFVQISRLNRLHIRIACRAFTFSAVESVFKGFWGSRMLVCDLYPLSFSDIKIALQDNNLDAEAFLSEIAYRGLTPLTKKPVTLQFLIKKIKRSADTLLQNLGLVDLYLDGCRELCREPKDETCHPLKPLSKLEVEHRLTIAARTAAINIFCNRPNIWVGQGLGEDCPEQDIFIREICEKDEGFDLEKGVKFSKDTIQETFDTSLFSSHEFNRIKWSHKTFAEFLAAWYVNQHKVSLERIRYLFFSSKDLDSKLVPQLYEVAAWMANMRTDILEEIIRTDPAVLLQTDVPTDSNVKSAIVANLLAQPEEGQLLIQEKTNQRYYAKLTHPGLANQLLFYIRNSSKTINSRDLAIDIAAACEITELQGDLANLALDASQSIHLRVSATKAIGSFGDAETKKKLKPLVIQELEEDDSDRLKGAALDVLWPTYLETQEVFHILTRPKKRNLYGTYQYFIDHDLAKNLQPEDLVLALQWLEQQGVRCFGHPFESLGNSILLKAWENFDLDGMVESFTRVALIQWKEHQKIITRDNDLQEKFSSLISNDSAKRRALVEKAVLMASATEENPFFLCSSLTDDILHPEDIFWMLQKLQESDSEAVQKNWSQLILWKFDRHDKRQTSKIITAAQKSKVLEKVFSPLLTPVELLSTQAEKMRVEFEKQHSLLEPSPQERVTQYLERLESGDLSAWWQLNMEMTLKSNSQYYGDEFEIDLTKLPGWKEAEEVTQIRIVEGAKKYIQEQDDIDYEWIGTNTFNRPSVAGCKALYLMLKEESNLINQLSLEKWKVWSPIIIAYPSSNQHGETYLDLVKDAYLHTPQESLNLILKLIDIENQEHEYLFVIDRLEKCWDKRLKLAFLEKAKDFRLAPKCFGQLLEKLLQEEFEPAKEYAKSLIHLPLSLDEYKKERALVAARVLVENSDISSWSFIWSLIQTSQEFGREVIERVAYRFPNGLQLNMTEKQIADLYAWMVRQYPYDQDPDHSNEVMAFALTTRDSVARLRDSLLSQLKERGTPEACSEIQNLIQIFPELEWLRRTLISAKANMRRTTWQPLTPKEFLRLVISQDPSNLDLSNQLNTMEKKMEDEPKIKNEINISNSPNTSINAPVGTSGITDSHVTLPNVETKKGINWGILLAVIGIIVSVLVSGAFNEEFKEGLNRMFSPQVEKEFTP